MRRKKKNHSTSPNGFQNHSNAVDPQGVLPGGENIPEVEKGGWLLVWISLNSNIFVFIVYSPSLFPELASLKQKVAWTCTPITCPDHHSMPSLNACKTDALIGQRQPASLQLCLCSQMEVGVQQGHTATTVFQRQCWVQDILILETIKSCSAC